MITENKTVCLRLRRRHDRQAVTLSYRGKDWQERSCHWWQNAGQSWNSLNYFHCLAVTAATRSWRYCRVWTVAVRWGGGLQPRRWSPRGRASGPSACCRVACGRRCGRILRCVGDSCPGADAPWPCEFADFSPVRNPPASAWSGPAGHPSSGSDRLLSFGPRFPRAATQSTLQLGLVWEKSKWLEGKREAWLGVR